VKQTCRGGEVHLRSDGPGAFVGASVLTAEGLEDLALGLLMPLFLHNLNNRLVGVLGNIDLAALSAPASDRVLARVEEARNAAAPLRMYLDRLGELAGRQRGRARTGLRRAVEEAGRLASTAAGRAVSTRSEHDEASASATVPGAAACIISSLAAAALLELRGSGTMSMSCRCFEGRAGATVRWEFPKEGQRNPAMAEGASFLLSECSAVARAGGMSLDLRSLGAAGGEAELVCDAEMEPAADD